MAESGTKNGQWLLAARPVGMVKESDFEYVETEIPKALDGTLVVRTLYVSFDPTMRGWMEDRESYLPPVAIGEPMRASGVGQVIESRLDGFEPGDFVHGLLGWQEYALCGPGMTKVPEGMPITLPLHLFGITGLTAYFGMLEIGKPKSGETVVVSGAAGATGSIAGQIARIHGARVIGIAGGKAKCGWLTDEARFDAAIDYKGENVAERLRELCPDGIDVYFDNVGGDILDAALAQLAMRARVVLCGGISRYNDEKPTPGPSNYMNLIIQRARMEGFIILDYAARFAEGAAELAGWLGEDQLVY
ncbi:MAG: NADP-dependent oxidoreductase, partial [Deltaproteobacteria bacterium]|nr:NADP-dependent oxidoreductase [Deltaproteobacteria bacterium]